MGAGHTVTAFYEVSQSADLKSYTNGLLLNISLRYKLPSEDISRLITNSMASGNYTNSPSENFRFASSVAEWGMLLRGSAYKEGSSFDSILERAPGAIGPDEYGLRQEFIDLVKKSKTM